MGPSTVLKSIKRKLSKDSQKSGKSNAKKAKVPAKAGTSATSTTAGSPIDVDESSSDETSTRASKSDYRARVEDVPDEDDDRASTLSDPSSHGELVPDAPEVEEEAKLSKYLTLKSILESRRLTMHKKKCRKVGRRQCTRSSSRL